MGRKLPQFGMELEHRTNYELNSINGNLMERIGVIEDNIDIDIQCQGSDESVNTFVLPLMSMYDRTKIWLTSSAYQPVNISVTDLLENGIFNI